MLILSLDSTGAGCGTCVWQDGKIRAQAEERMERGQDRRLMPLIVETMQKADVDYSALDRIAVTRGPGSFTGLRIGLAAARGIGLAAEKPVLGVDRFAIYREQMNQPMKTGKNLLIVIDSKRRELFCRFYPAAGAPDDPQMLTHDDIVTFLKAHKNTVTAGDTPDGLQPSAEKEVITCAALAARGVIGDADFLPRPLYIRAPDVTFPRAAKGG